MDPTTTVTPPAAPVAATAAEIEAACPGAPDSFVLGQIKRGATLAQVNTAFVAHLRAENDQLKAAASKPGIEPLGNGAKPKAATPVDGDPIAAWEEALSAKFDVKTAGLSDEKKIAEAKQRAVAALVREQPDLHQAYLAAYNAQHARKR